MQLPDLTHLQCLIIENLGANKLTGRELRARLTSAGAKKSGPAFYQLMSRLEEANLVEGHYTQKIVDGQIIKERVYRVTGQGQKALAATVNFYRQLSFGGSPAYA
jgi:DNA-binding PadR family transcriptional regulator